MKVLSLPNWLIRGSVVVILAIIFYSETRLEQLMAIPSDNGTAVWPLSGLALTALFLLGYDVLQDIIFEKRTEKTVRESEERFRAIFEQAAVGIALATPDGYLSEVNQKFCHMLGYSEEELLALRIANISHPDDLAVELEYARFCMEDGISTYSMEKRYARKDGSIVWGNIAVSLVRESTGNPKYAIAVVEDISDGYASAKGLRKQAEYVLQKNQHLYQTLATVSPVGIFRTDAIGNCLYVNQQWCKIAGMTLEEAKENGWIKAIHPEDRERICDEWERAIAANLQFKSEYRLVRPDGGETWVVGQAVAEISAAKETIGYVGTIADISDRKVLERELAWREQILKDFIASAPVGIAIINEQLRFLQVNEWIAEINGASVADHLGKKIDEILPQLAPVLEPIYRQILTTGEPIINIEISGETPLQPGVLRYWLVSYFPIRNANGKPAAVGVVLVEITARKQAEAALMQSEERLRAVLENMPVMMTAFNEEGSLVVWNRECERVSGYSALEMLHNPLTLPLLYPDAIYRDRMLAEWRDRGNDYRNWEWNLTCKDESVKMIAWSNISDRFPIPGWATWGIGVDVTDRTEAEKALRQSEARERAKAQQLEVTLHELQQTQSQLIQTEKMSSLGQLVAGVAHEINNPISFIYGNIIHASEYIRDLLRLVQLYQRHYPQPDLEIATCAENIEIDFVVEDLPKLLDSMKLGAERIRQIVLSLRNFSRLDESEMKPVDIHSGIDSTLLILQHRLNESSERPGIEVIKDLGNLPEVTCYAGQLNQVFINILTNAIDALLEGNGQKVMSNSSEKYDRPLPITDYRLPTIHIRTEVVGRDRVKIEIEDNGPGMSESVQKYLFDPFFTTKPVGKGTGLGLAISYQIVVEKHGGQLTCISAPGQGTKFAIEIPIQQQSKS